MELYRAIQKDDDHQYAKETLDFIVQTIDSFGLECVSICFNGGKDCTVLLHLLAAALAYIRQRDNIPPPTTHDGRVTSSHDAIVDIPVVYFKVDREFDELYQFNNDMMDMYNFKMVEFDGTDMKQCLYNMLDYYPKMKAIFMGQRMGDPGSQYLAPVQHCDPGWPPITRVNAILNWSYAQVWQFLIAFRLPYCRLYELGYTSLGTRALTLPNPALLKENIKDVVASPVVAAPVTEASSSSSSVVAADTRTADTRTPTVASATAPEQSIASLILTTPSTSSIVLVNGTPTTLTNVVRDVREVIPSAYTPGLLQNASSPQDAASGCRIPEFQSVGEKNLPTMFPELDDSLQYTLHYLKANTNSNIYSPSCCSEVSNITKTASSGHPSVLAQAAAMSPWPATPSSALQFTTPPVSPHYSPLAYMSTRFASYNVNSHCGKLTLHSLLHRKTCQHTHNSHNVTSNVIHNNTTGATTKLPESTTFSIQFASDSTLPSEFGNDATNADIALCSWPYLPAFVLADASLERAGRVPKPKKAPVAPVEAKQEQKVATVTTSACVSKPEDVELSKINAHMKSSRQDDASTSALTASKL